MKGAMWTALGAACVAGTAAYLRGRRAFDLRDKVVLITGGSRGLGLVLAREFASRGSRVAVCARSREELSKAEDDFRYRGEKLIAVECDLTDRAQVRRMTSTVEGELGPVDVLVNNAGTILVGPLENHELEDLERVMQTNFWAAVYTTLEVLPKMKGRQSGRIVNIASIGSKVAVPHLLAYSASKFALYGFSQGLRAEVAKDGISVTTAVPGLMRTGSPRHVETKGQHEKEYSWFIVSDSMPGVSMSATRAAKKIVDACAAGRGEIQIGLPAKLVSKAAAIAPNVVGSFMGALNAWVLPSSTDGKVTKKGYEAENPVTRGPLTSLTRRAEVANNQSAP